MKAWLVAMLLLVTVISLAGCGQKGALYRESPPQPGAAAVPDAAPGATGTEPQRRDPESDAR